jgi:hypothetical protein
MQKCINILVVKKKYNMPCGAKITPQRSEVIRELKQLELEAYPCSKSEVYASTELVTGDSRSGICLAQPTAS